MASYLKPRRGALSAISTTTLLSGEVFFETPSGIGGGKGRIMMGDGSTAYKGLTTKYFLDFDSTAATITSNVTASDGTSLSNLAASYGTNWSIPNLVRTFKRALYNIESSIAKLNNDKVGITAGSTPRIYVWKDVFSSTTNISKVTNLNCPNYGVMIGLSIGADSISYTVLQHITLANFTDNWQSFCIHRDSAASYGGTAFRAFLLLL